MDGEDSCLPSRLDISRVSRIGCFYRGNLSMKNNCICGKFEHQLLFNAGVYKIVSCEHCKQIRTISPVNANRTQEYTEADLRVYLEKQEMFRAIFRRIISFIQRYQTGGVFVDIGAGVGLLVDTAKGMGFEAYGVEPSVPSVRAARKYFGVTLHTTLSDIRKKVKHADVALLNHVLEHLPEPKKTLIEVKNMLKPQGYLVIGVPNIGSWIGSLKKARWQSLIPDQHRWHFSLRTLDQLVVPLGFERVGVISDNHDRSIHPLWKRPMYWLVDKLSEIFANGEAILVVYRKS